MIGQAQQCAGLIALAIMPWFAALGQPNSPKFEVASVKPSANGQRGVVMRGGPGTADPGQITYSNVALITILRAVYSAYPFQIVGPGWLTTDTYDISAKLAPGTTTEQFHLMLLALLKDRFRLALHREVRQVSGYELVVGPGGSKLMEATPLESSTQQSASAASATPKTGADGFPSLNSPGVAMGMKMLPNAKRPSVLLTARSQEISGLIHLLGEQLGRAVVDKTGLTRKYDYKFEFVPDAGAPPAPPLAADTLPTPQDEPGSSILAAVQEQLGLKLVPSKSVPLDMIIIDGGARVPTAN